jgi:uncharacterized protein
MPVIINIKHLENGVKQYQGRLELEHLEIDTQDELIRPSSDLEYHLSAEILDKNILIRGDVRLKFHFECSRCLTPFEKETHLETWSQLIPFHGAEAIPVDNDCIDLTPFLREDMLLSLPQHPLCAKDCRGINISAEKATESPSVQTELEKKPSAWSALDKLHLE